MRTKLLSAVLLASTALTGVASASPIVRDHRYQRPAARPQQSQRYYRDHDHDRDRDRDRNRVQWSGGVQVTTQPSWMPQVNYGYQVDADGDAVTPYNYGADPYVEGIARNQWMTLVDDMRLPSSDTDTTVNLAGQHVRSIELRAESGQSYISGVWVTLTDGRKFPISVARYLDASKEPNLRLDLGPNVTCGVASLQIGGFSYPGASFDIIGA